MAATRGARVRVIGDDFCVVELSFGRSRHCRTVRLERETALNWLQQALLAAGVREMMTAELAN